ncbi:hypothetical protein ACROYT_G041752 [Oculina patagonica]
MITPPTACFPLQQEMEAKFHLCLLLIILGTITVQCASLGNQQDNPMHVLSKRQGYGSLMLNKRTHHRPKRNAEAIAVESKILVNTYLLF